MSNITLYQGDCLEEMKKIPAKSVDLVLCDLPYGTLDANWDCCIDLEKLWKEYKRILTDKGNILLFGDGSMFTARLTMSKKTWFKYNWFWNKDIKTGYLNAKKQPMRIIETISVFGHPGQNNYYPQMEEGKPFPAGKGQKIESGAYKGKTRSNNANEGTRYPSNLILKFKGLSHQGRLHTSQKPVELLEYLIKTYTEENMTVLDNTMGSGSTMVACINTNRNGIGIELDEDYFNIAKTRIEGDANDDTIIQ